MPIDKTQHGNYLREERMRNGFTQQQLAHLIGASPQAISQYERNERQISMSQAQKLATVLNCDMYQLLGLDLISLNSQSLTLTDRIQIGISIDLGMLNEKGLEEAQKRIHEMTQLAQYRKQSSREE